MSSNPLLILVDGHSSVYRPYYAYAKSISGGLTALPEVTIITCFGFVKALIEIINSKIFLIMLKL